jgi:hypothetical protein
LLLLGRTGILLTYTELRQGDALKHFSRSTAGKRVAKIIMMMIIIMQPSSSFLKNINTKLKYEAYD